MALIVNTNLASQIAQINLGRHERTLRATYERLSSGLRINRASDDAAGLAVATNLSAQAASALVASRNTNDGISVVQTAEGAADEVSNVLTRMRELAVQASSETLGNTERAYISAEYQDLADEIDRIANATDFNGIALGEGTNTTINVQVGVNGSANDQIAIGVGDLRTTLLGIDTSTVVMTTAAGAQTAIGLFDTALDTVSGYMASYGASQNRLGSALNTLDTYYANMTAAQAQIQDADFALETAAMATGEILQQASIAVLAQANSINKGVLALL